MLIFFVRGLSRLSPGQTVEYTVLAVTPFNLPILPARVFILSCGASMAILIMLTPLARYGTPILPNMNSPNSCSMEFMLSTELTSSIMIEITATLVCIAIFLSIGVSHREKYYVL